MSTAAKWLLIVLLALIIHAIFMTSVEGVVGGDSTDVFPFRSIDAVDIEGIVAVEMLLAFVLLIGLAVALLRHSDW